MHTHIHAYNTCLLMYIHTCMHTDIHTYINTYIHTYIHTYMHLFLNRDCNFAALNNEYDAKGGNNFKNKQKQVDILISKNQVLQIFTMLGMHINLHG